ncbi:unnamed protein product [marine sediment metagenome]|uniref:HTH marR-type domain-containing protein n=1 Tax=marine sediment metagenome TaxID=412755 RepID=X1J7U4_9ZZZZ
MYQVEAYVITAAGLRRYSMETNQEVTYEEAQILGALKQDGKSTIGELGDVCSSMYSPAVRHVIDSLLTKGLIERVDKTL